MRSDTTPFGLGRDLINETSRGSQLVDMFIRTIFTSFSMGVDRLGGITLFSGRLVLTMVVLLVEGAHQAQLNALHGSWPAVLSLLRS